jgi:hypothetical protein
LLTKKKKKKVWYLKRGGGEIGDRRSTKLDGRNGTENLLVDGKEEEFFDALHKAGISLDLPATEAAIFSFFLAQPRVESNPKTSAKPTTR